MKKIILAMLTCHFAMAGITQIPKTYTSSEILLKLKKLKVLGTVLYMAAHPDDENTRLIAWLANEKLFQTGYLSLTRGDGGQNLIGDEQGIELGLIRTQELLAARRIDGGRQFFTRAYDFGYSKSTDEALNTWNREKVLSDAVWVIRNFKPDVIVTRFPPDNRAGHGHHSASAVLAMEAFDAAADPGRFPGQLEHGTTTWQVKRVLWNNYNFGNTNTIDSTQFKLDAGGYNPLLGQSYGELAAESRSLHKSQGFGVPRGRGSQMEYFTVLKGDKPAEELTDGIITDWSRVPGAAAIPGMIDQLINSYRVESPESSVPGLIEILKAIRQLPENHWKTIKAVETEELIRLCAGLYLEATTGNATICQGDSLKYRVSIINRTNQPVLVKTAYIGLPDSPANAVMVLSNRELVNNRPLVQNSSYWIDPYKIPVTQPYWLEYEKEKGHYTVEDQKLIGRPDVLPALVLSVNFSIGGVDIPAETPVRYSHNDPVKGELIQPLTVVPKVEMKFGQDNYLGTNEKPVTVVSTVKSNCSDTAVYTIHKVIPDTWATRFGSFKFDNKSKSSVMDTSVFEPKPRTLNTVSELALKSQDAFAGYQRNIEYDHIPAITYFKPATAHILNVDIKTGGKNIGYIPGAGDKVAEDLQLLGYNVTMLAEQDIRKSNLQRFDAIVTGVRAYNVQDWLSEKYEVLMDYVQKGGNLVVQYNTNNFVGPLRAKMAPYALNINRSSRITDETAAVKFLLPNHPVLNFPNKITAADFEGWIQERSVYHADQLDSRYEAILSMADAGEEPHNGALVVAPYGKGNFVYTGLVFFREMPAGIPGAYRLMANLLALPKH